MKTSKHAIFVILGAIMLTGGLIIIKLVTEPQGVMRALPYVLIGLGCGVFGHGMGELLKFKSIKKHPELAKQIEVDQKDERNVEINNRAKAKAFDLMIFVLGALMLSFALMGVEVIAILLLAAAYLFIVGYRIYYLIKYDKEI